MNRIKILEIGDMQNGFTREDGNLYVPGAKDLISPANEFLRRVGNDVFDLVLVVLDTHFREEYRESEEARQFPLHCEYGTRDWELSIALPGLRNTRYLMKNNFSMWADPVQRALSFTDPAKKVAYENLFHILDDPRDPTERTPRDEFLDAINPGGASAEIEVILMGVASDYCNRYSMEGWLSLGARVTILQDLTKGIGKETHEILSEDRYRRVVPDRLRAIGWKDYLREPADA